MLQRKLYSYWFLTPLALIYGLLFLLPVLLSFFFSLTVWTLSDYKFVGFYNFITLFTESYLKTGIKNTFVFAIITCIGKVVLGFLIAVFLTSSIRSKNFIRSVVYFPHIISTLAIGLTFSALMHPTRGLLNTTLHFLGFAGLDWLGDTSIALFSIIFTDIWKDVGVATIMYIAGIEAIPKSYYEAASLDGAGAWAKFWQITFPLCRASMNTVIILALIGGMRTFDMVWAMTKGGPGFATDVLASIVYKQYAGGYYGLATAGNVVMLVMIGIIVFPLYYFLLNKERDL